MRRATAGLVLALVSVVPIPSGASAGERTMTCGVYARLDRVCHCPDDTDYFRVYALPICTRFSRAFGWSAEGRTWRDHTIACLLRSAVDVSRRDHGTCDCQAIKEAAIQSHVACYTAQSPSFCTLARQDSDLIYRTFSAEELRSWLIVRQSVLTVLACVSSLFPSFAAQSAP